MSKMLYCLIRDHVNHSSFPTPPQSSPFPAVLDFNSQNPSGQGAEDSGNGSSDPSVKSCFKLLTNQARLGSPKLEVKMGKEPQGFNQRTICFSYTHIHTHWCVNTHTHTQNMLHDHHRVINLPKRDEEGEAIVVFILTTSIFFDACKLCPNIQWLRRGIKSTSFSPAIIKTVHVSLCLP